MRSRLLTAQASQDSVANRETVLIRTISLQTFLPWIGIQHPFRVPIGNTMTPSSHLSGLQIAMACPQPNWKPSRLSIGGLPSSVQSETVSALAWATRRRLNSRITRPDNTPPVSSAIIRTVATTISDLAVLGVFVHTRENLTKEICQQYLRH